MGYRLDKKQGKGNSPKITIRLTDLQYKILKNIEKKENKNKSDIIREAIDWFLTRKRLYEKSN